MLNHWGHRIFGCKHIPLAYALLLGGEFFLARPAQPTPPAPRTAAIGQIVELVDVEGRRIYINSSASDPPPVFGALRRASASQSLSGSRLRTPDFGLTSLLIRQAADRHQMDPELIHAVIHVESGYDARAVSPKGAMGLMQLIPATARRFGVDDPFDPQQNIEGGTSYLSYLLSLFSGDLSLSLAAYNAGENSVLREGGIPPFAETREYVRKVRSLYQPMSASHATGGEGGPAPGVRSPKPSVATGKVTGQSEKPKSAPVYTYVDAHGVVHIEQ